MTRDVNNCGDYRTLRSRAFDAIVLYSSAFHDMDLAFLCNMATDSGLFPQHEKYAVRTEPATSQVDKNTKLL